MLDFKDPVVLSFVYNLMNAENSIKLGYDKIDGLWFPHPSVEGGTDTIAFGHKLTYEEEQDEVFDNGINFPEAVTLFLNDLEYHYIEIQNGWNNTKSQSEPFFNKLETEYQLILTDLCYNIGLSGVVRGGKWRWPKLKQAILSDDTQEVYEQSVRTYRDRTGQRIYLWNRSTIICQAVGIQFLPKT